MMLCPNCKKGGLLELQVAKLTSPPLKVQRRYRCPHCGYITDELDDVGEETEAQRLMREHLRDYHGVE